MFGQVSRLPPYFEHAESIFYTGLPRYPHSPYLVPGTWYLVLSGSRGQDRRWKGAALGRAGRWKGLPLSQQQESRERRLAPSSVPRTDPFPQETFLGELDASVLANYTAFEAELSTNYTIMNSTVCQKVRPVPAYGTVF